MRKINITGRRSESSEPEIDPENPPLDETFFANAVRIEPGAIFRFLGSGTKRQITLRIDEDIIDFFKKHGKGYQRLMNFALRAYMVRQQTAEANMGKKKKRTA